jgi:hypothetical protein
MKLGITPKREPISFAPVLKRIARSAASSAGRDRLRGDALLRGPALRRLGEVEPLELHAAHRQHAELRGALQNTLERLARADRRRRSVGLDEFAQEERHAVVPRHAPVGVEVEPRERIGKAVLPAGQRAVVVADVGAVPAEHDVAEAEAAIRRLLSRTEELVLVQVLAAQDAVDVADGDLDLAGAAVAHGLQRRMLAACRVLLACHACSLSPDRPS